MRRNRQLYGFFFASLAAGCAAAGEPIEASWTRGTDLEIYSSLSDISQMARSEAGCSERYANATLQRQLAVRRALIGVHGVAAVSAAEKEEGTAHPKCALSRSRYYRDRYETALGTLEQRYRLLSAKGS